MSELVSRSLQGHHYAREMSKSETELGSTKAHHEAPDWLVLTIACIAQFMVVLDVSIVNVALPSMGQDLHFTYSSAQWVINAYVLTFAGFLLLGGRAADFFGRRNVYLTGIVVFTLASIGAGVAHTAAEMVTVRAIQGVGGAILSPATLTIIVTTFQGPRLPKAIGAWSAMAGAGGAVGALLGGILTGLVSWRWIFFINVPIGVVAGTIAVLYLREMRNKDATSKLDVTGAVLVTGGLASVIYAVVNTTTHAWSSTFTLSWLFAGFVLIVGFLFWERRIASHPLVPFRVFRSRPLSVANGVMVLVGGVFFAMWYFLTYYFQFVLGYGALQRGLRLRPDGDRHHRGRTDLLTYPHEDGRASTPAGRRDARDARLPLALVGPTDEFVLGQRPRARLRDGVRDGSAVRAARDRGDRQRRPQRRRSRVGHPQHRAPGGWLAGPRHLGDGRDRPNRALTARGRDAKPRPHPGLSACLSNLRRDHVVGARTDIRLTPTYRPRRA